MWLEDFDNDCLQRILGHHRRAERAIFTEFTRGCSPKSYIRYTLYYFIFDVWADERAVEEYDGIFS